MAQIGKVGKIKRSAQTAIWVACFATAMSAANLADQHPKLIFVVVGAIAVFITTMVLLKVVDDKTDGN